MWFKRNKNKPGGPAARPLTLERVYSVFDNKDWTYQLAQDNLSLATGFHGLPLRIVTIGDGLHVIATCRSDELTAERFPEVLTWVEDFNNDHAFPTAIAFYDDDNMVAVGANFAIPGSWEYTDNQLDEWLECGISGTVDLSKAFYTTFDPDGLQRGGNDRTANYSGVSQARVDQALTEMGLPFERGEDGSTVLKFKELECSIFASDNNFVGWALWQRAATNGEDIDQLRLVINEVNKEVPKLRVFAQESKEGVRPRGFVLFPTNEGASDGQLESMLNCFLQSAHIMAAQLADHAGHLSLHTPSNNGEQPQTTWSEKDTDKPAGPRERPVDIERIRTIFEKNDWSYIFDEEHKTIRAEFDGADQDLTITTEPAFLKIASSCGSDKLPLEKLPVALAWADDFNGVKNPFPTVFAIRDEKNNQARIGATFTIPLMWGYSEAQLREWLQCGLTGVLEVCWAFYEEFDPSALS